MRKDEVKKIKGKKRGTCESIMPINELLQNATVYCLDRLVFLN
jgi:hypothetical protein